MVDYTKQDMRNIWASTGDVAAPTAAKVSSGWAVEVPPRQYWNWIENRQDAMLAYLAQKGIPEWDNTTDYVTNRSYVQYNNVVYKAVADNTNVVPGTDVTKWVVAFATSSDSLEALKPLTVAANQLPYFSGVGVAATTSLTPFARTILDDADADAVRTTISAQALNTNLTALSALTAAVNKIPYFTGSSTAALADITAQGRALLAAMDAAAGRAVISAAKTGANADIDSFSNAITFNNTATFTTDVVVPTQSLGNNTTKAASTGFVQNELATPRADISNLQTQKANLASPALTGTPTTPTATAGDTSTQVANSSFVNTAVQNAKVSPAFTGTPTAPTPTAGDNTTKIATTEFATTLVNNRLTNPTLTGTVTINGTPVIATGTSSLKVTSNGLDLTQAGPVTAATPAQGDNSTKLATTAFVAIAAAPPQVGDVLVSANTPDMSKYVFAQSYYAQSSYSALYGKVGLVPDYPIDVPTVAQNPQNTDMFYNGQSSQNTGGIVYGNGRMVTVGWDGYNGGQFAWYSTDQGSTFNRVQISTGGTTYTNTGGVLFGAGLFVSGARDNNYVWTSPDGATWTARTTTGLSALYSMAWNGSKFLATSNASNAASLSSDGINWTAATLPISVNQNEVLLGFKGLFILFLNTTNNKTYYTSPDGITWTTRTFPVAISITDFAMSPTTLLIYLNGPSASSSTGFYTTDGINWTASPLFPKQYYYETPYKIFYANGEFCFWTYTIIGTNNTQVASLFMYSSVDCKSWVQKRASGVVSSIGRANYVVLNQTIFGVGSTTLFKYKTYGYDTSTNFYTGGPNLNSGTYKTYIRAIS